MTTDSDIPVVDTAPAWSYPAGWMQDPAVSGQWRYWDGAEWTSHTAPYEPLHQAGSKAVQAPRPITNGWAFASFVCGFGTLTIPIFGFYFFNPWDFTDAAWPYMISACLAVIFGVVGLYQIRKSNGIHTGRALAITGLAFGSGPFVVVALLILVIALWPMLSALAG